MPLRRDRQFVHRPAARDGFEGFGLVMCSIAMIAGCHSMASSSSKDFAEGDCPKPMNLIEFGANRHPLTLLEVNSGGGTRTPDTRIMIPLL